METLTLPFRTHDTAGMTFIYDTDDRVVAMTPTPSDPPMKTMVHRVNCHDALLAALRAVTNDYDPTGCENCGVIGGETIDLVNAAIRKAEQD